MPVSFFCFEVLLPGSILVWRSFTTALQLWGNMAPWSKCPGINPKQGRQMAVIPSSVPRPTQQKPHQAPSKP